MIRPAPTVVLGARAIGPMLTPAATTVLRPSASSSPAMFGTTADGGGGGGSGARVWPLTLNRFDWPEIGLGTTAPPLPLIRSTLNALNPVGLPVTVQSMFGSPTKPAGGAGGRHGRDFEMGVGGGAREAGGGAEPA